MVVALLAGALVAGSLVYACVEGKARLRRIVAGVALALLPLVPLDLTPADTKALTRLVAAIKKELQGK